MINQTEGKNQTKNYQPEIGAFVEQFLTLITATVQNSVNNAAKSILNELKQQQNQPSEIADGYLTRTQIADFLHVSLPTLHRYQCEGLISAIHIGRKCLYNKAEVIESLKTADKRKGKRAVKN